MVSPISEGNTKGAVKTLQKYMTFSGIKKNWDIRWDNCLSLTIKIPELRSSWHSGLFTAGFAHISSIVPLFSPSTASTFGN